LHRVEALVRVQKPAQLEALPLFVLKAAALAHKPSLDEIEQPLHLGKPLVRQILRRLEAEELIESNGDQAWALTPLGRQSLENGIYPRASHERRSFYFVESEQPGQPPHPLGLRNHPATVPWPAPEDWRFDTGLLEAALRRPAEWKAQHGFPTDVQEIVAAGPQTWQGIILDRPERLLAAMVLTPMGTHGEQLLGFGVQQEGWGLQTGEPAFVVTGSWQQVLPELAVAPSAEDWRQAWRAWCQPRALPAAEIDACGLEPHGCRLRVLAPSRLLERLRASRSDALKGEAWVLAGTGRLRTAARLDVVEAGREGAGGSASEKK
jgi:hypothetical protein